MKAYEKEMWNSVEVHNIYSENGGYKLNRRNLANILKNYFCDSLTACSSPGVASIFAFRKYVIFVYKIVMM